jgi:hypothetical protein
VKFESWFPVVTLLVGFLASSAIEWFRDRRTLKREREARESMRREKRADRRGDFQRETLLALQDSLLELGRSNGEIYHLDLIAYHRTGEFVRQRISEELNERNRLANGRTSVLTSRVRDVAVREMIQTFSDYANVETMSRDLDEAREAANLGIRLFVKINERIGELLRKLDDDEG